MSLVKNDGLGRHHTGLWFEPRRLPYLGVATAEKCVRVIFTITRIDVRESEFPEYWINKCSFLSLNQIFTKSLPSHASIPPTGPGPISASFLDLRRNLAASKPSN